MSPDEMKPSIRTKKSLSVRKGVAQREMCLFNHARTSSDDGRCLELRTEVKTFKLDNRSANLMNQSCFQTFTSDVYGDYCASGVAEVVWGLGKNKHLLF